MQPQPLSPETRSRVEAIFAPTDRVEAEQLLVQECGTNLPFLENLNSHELERHRFAAIKLSGGTLDGLQRAIAVAKTDWRDLLVAAGFGQDLTAHQRWRPSGS